MSGRDSDRVALASASVELTYRELDAVEAELARRLERLAGGAGRGELVGARVAIVAANVPALVVAMHATWMAGGACVPVSARLREFDLRRVLEDARPTLLVAAGAQRDRALAALVAQFARELPTVCGCSFLDDRGETVDEMEVSSRDPGGDALDEGTAAVLYTSGTTGAPKGALVSHACLEGEASELALRLGLSPADTTALVVPASHAFGLACLLAAFDSGGTTTMVDSTFSLKALIEEIESRGATVVHGSPTLFAGLRAARRDRLASLRAGYVGGAPCAPSLIEELESTGLALLNVFGMTELGAACSCLADDPPEVRRETVGSPFPGFEFRAAPAEGCEPGTAELQVRGPFVTGGYFRKQALTDDAFDGDWFRTGDLGAIDGRGNVRISGRLKELVHVGGFNVFPAEVESLLMTHPDVSQVAVVGVPHERMGEALVAYVVARSGSTATPAELRRFARARIAGYKLPYRIELLPELPSLASGKPDRSGLRERALNSVGEAAAVSNG